MIVDVAQALRVEAWRKWDAWARDSVTMSWGSVLAAVRDADAAREALDVDARATHDRWLFAVPMTEVLHVGRSD